MSLKYVEYCNYNKYIEDYDQELKNIFSAIENDANGLAVPVHFVNEIKGYLPEGIVLSTPIDFPLGYSSVKTRTYMLLNSLKSGANAIDYVPSQYFFNCKLVELIKEIEMALEICKDYGATLRVFFKYRQHEKTTKMAKIMSKAGVELGFPSLGWHSEDFYDNLIVCKSIEEETGMSSIFNGKIWLPEHLELVESSGIFGLRVYDPIWCNYNKD